MRLIDAIKLVITEPDTYANKIKNKSKKDSLIFILKAFAIFAVLSFLINIKGIYERTLDAGSNFALVLITGFVLYIVISIILIFAGSVLLHLFAKFMGSKEKFSDTFAIYSYGSLPYAIIGWIPFISLVGVVYTFYIQIVALKHGHFFSNTKAIVAYVLHFVAILAIIGIIQLFY